MSSLLLGILNSQAAAVVGEAYEWLETQELSGTQASISFTNLSSAYSDYQHFQLRWVASMDTINRWVSVQLNSDTGGNYDWYATYGAGLASFGGTKGAHLALYQYDNTSTTAISAGITEIYDVFSTNKYKTISSFAAMANSPYQQIHINGSAWKNTNAVDTITVVPTDGTGAASGNFADNTRVSLYGLRSA